MQQRKALFGYTGFVGGWLLRNYHFHDVYNSANIQQATNQQFDVVFFAALPAAKWYANKYPNEDWSNIQRIMTVLDTIHITKQFILISTIDVYGAAVANGVDEFSPFNEQEQHPYGLHRARFEMYVRSRFGNTAAIIRLPGLFGEGLKKNIIYDVLQQSGVEQQTTIPTTTTTTTLQWFDMKQLGRVIEDYQYFTGLHAVNITPPPIETYRVINTLLGRAPPSDLPPISATAANHYNVKSILYCSQSVDAVLESIAVYGDEFRRNQERKRKRPYKLGVSNLTAPQNYNVLAWYQLLRGCFGIDYNEVAPTKLQGFSWQNDLKPIISEVYAIQSISFGLTFNIFMDMDEALRHMKRVVTFARLNGVRRIVFGCPKNRRVPDDWIPSETRATEGAVAFFQHVAQMITMSKSESNELFLCIENNSKQYGCNFLTTPADVASFVRLVNRPDSIAMMVDVGNCVMEGLGAADIDRCIRENADIIKHIHVSEPHMKPLNRDFEDVHTQVAQTLRDVGYNQGVTLEMGTSSALECSTSIDLFRTIY